MTASLTLLDCSASPCVQGMAGSTSACTSPSPDIALFVTSSGKVTPQLLSWRGWLTRPWLRHLYGTISSPSTALAGVASFKSSLPAIPVSRSAMRGIEEDPLTHGIFGPMSPGSCGRSIPNGSFVKTSKATSIWDFPKSVSNFKTWALQLRRDCSRREKLALDIAGAGCSSWPTPTASDAGYVPDLTISKGLLRSVAPTHVAEGSGGQFSLNEAARTWSALWMILQSVGWSAKHAKSPCSLPVRVSFRSGNGSFLSGLISNPRFYDLIMGWPIGWSAPEEPVMGFAAWLQRSRGELSKLLICPEIVPG